MSKRIKQGDSKLAVAYIRVSTKEQKLGPEAQRSQIEAWAAREGVTVASWHVDQGVSGASDLVERPALLAGLGALRTLGAGLVLVAKRDRIARDSHVLTDVERAVAAAGARLMCADGSGNAPGLEGLVTRSVFDLIAQVEREQIRSRTKAALAVIRASGRKTGGGVPFGSQLAEDGRPLVPLASEQATIALARQLATIASLREVARILEEEGHLSRSGFRFSACQVARMLTGKK